MSNQITITAILDEEDGTPVFEVKDGRGNATNAVTMKDAAELAEKWITPALSIEEIAKDWILAHGTNLHDDFADDVREEYNADLTWKQVDDIADLIAGAKVEITL